jgi:hypothetical protein
MSTEPPLVVKISVEGDSVIKLETDFADPDACSLALHTLFCEIIRRHGPVIARAAQRAIATTVSDRKVNNLRNAEWMSRFSESKLSLEKFAAALAEENEKLVADGRVDVILAERGPWGATNAETIKTHVRRMKRKGVLGAPPRPRAYEILYSAQNRPTPREIAEAILQEKKPLDPDIF